MYANSQHASRYHRAEAAAEEEENEYEEDIENDVISESDGITHWVSYITQVRAP